MRSPCTARGWLPLLARVSERASYRRAGVLTGPGFWKVAVAGGVRCAGYELRSGFALSALVL